MFNSNEKLFRTTPKVTYRVNMLFIQREITSSGSNINEHLHLRPWHTITLAGGTLETNNQSITTADPLRGWIAARHILEWATENPIQLCLKSERPTDSVLPSKVQRLTEHFHLTFLKDCLDILDNLVSASLHIFCNRCWFVLYGLKALSRALVACQQKKRGSTPLTLQQQLAEKSPIVLNGRKHAFMDQTFGTARAEPLSGNGKDGRRGGTEVSVLHIRLLLSGIFLFGSLSLAASPSRLFTTTTSHQDISVAQSWWVCRPRDGPAATLCLPLSTSKTLRPNHHVGMLMCAALGLPIEMPICGRGQLGTRGENGALTPGTCQSGGVGGGRGGEQPMQPETGNAKLDYIFSLQCRMETLHSIGWTVFPKECFFSFIQRLWTRTAVCHKDTGRSHKKKSLRSQLISMSHPPAVLK